YKHNEQYYMRTPQDVGSTNPPSARKLEWLDVVRDLYQQAWSRANDNNIPESVEKYRNELMVAWLRGNPCVVDQRLLQGANRFRISGIDLNSRVKLLKIDEVYRVKVLSRLALVIASIVILSVFGRSIYEWISLTHIDQKDRATL